MCETLDNRLQMNQQKVFNAAVFSVFKLTVLLLQPAASLSATSFLDASGVVGNIKAELKKS